jgi:hypothetical protein
MAASLRMHGKLQGYEVLQGVDNSKVQCLRMIEHIGTTYDQARGTKRRCTDMGSTLGNP